MNVKLVLVSALAAGAMTAAGMAQTAAPTAPAANPPAATPQAPPPPQAIPAKIAIIEFEQVAAATNEGQKTFADIQKKYATQKANLDQLQKEIETLTKALQNPPASMTDEAKASRARELDTKQKQLQRDGEDYSSSVNADVQDAMVKIEQKLGPVVMKYVQQGGFTLLLDNAPVLDGNGQQLEGGLRVLWGPGTDISAAVVEAYNASSGIEAPKPSASRPATPSRPAAPKPAAPKQ